MQFAKQVALGALLIGSWLLLFFILSIFTQLIMAPWDTAIYRPEVGTWQRTLNDFFEGSGALVVSIPVMLASILLTLSTLRTKPQTAAKFAFSNVVCVVFLWLAFLLAATINNQILYPYPPVTYDPYWEGYHRSVFPMGVMLVVCAGWLLWQRRAARRVAQASTSSLSTPNSHFS